MFNLSYLKQYKYHIIGSISLLVLFSIYKRFSNDIPSLSLPEKKDKKEKEKDISEEILNENKQLRKMLLLLTKELHKSTESIQKFNKNMEIKDNSLDFHKKYFIKDIEKRNILVDSIHYDSNVETTSKHKFPFVHLSEKFNNVIGFRLIRACVPHHPHTLHENNRKLYLEKDGTKYLVTFTTGSYTITELVNEIQNKLNDGSSWSVIGAGDPADHSSGFTCSVSLTDFKISITRPSFTYFLLEKSIDFAHLIGHEIKNESSGDNYGISYTFDNLPQTTSQYVDLCIDEIPHSACKLNSRSKNVVERIFLSGQQGDFIYHNSDNSHNHNQNYFNPQSLSSLTIHVLTEYNKDYICDNIHLSFEFEITILKNSELMMNSKVKPNIQSTLPN